MRQRVIDLAGRAAPSITLAHGRTRKDGGVSTGPESEPGLRNTLYRRLTRSGRRMTLIRRALYALAVPLAITIVRSWWATCRVV